MILTPAPCSVAARGHRHRARSALVARITPSGGPAFPRPGHPGLGHRRRHVAAPLPRITWNSSDGRDRLNAATLVVMGRAGCASTAARRLAGVARFSAPGSRRVWITATSSGSCDDRAGPGDPDRELLGSARASAADPGPYPDEFMVRLLGPDPHRSSPLAQEAETQAAALAR